MAVARAKGRHETDDYSIAELFSIGMPWPAAPSCPNVSSPWSACPRRPRSTTRDLTGSRVGADPEWAEQRAARAGRAAVQAYLPSAESDPDTLTPAGQSALESRWSWLARVAGQAMKEGDEGMVEDLLAGVQVWGFRPGGHHWRVSSSCTGIRIGWCLAPTASGSQRTVRQPNRVLLLAPATSLCSTQPRRLWSGCATDCDRASWSIAHMVIPWTTRCAALVARSCEPALVRPGDGIEP